MTDMFRFDEYCEKWAERFKPISHNPQLGSPDWAFYRMDDYDKVAELCGHISGAKSPAMAVSTHIELDADEQRPGLWHETLSAFILVRQEDGELNKELAAADAKVQGRILAEKFLAWLEYDKKENKNPDLQALNFDHASVFTAPAKFNGWWATEIMIINISKRNLCISPEDY